MREKWPLLAFLTGYCRRSPASGLSDAEKRFFLRPRATCSTPQARLWAELFGSAFTGAVFGLIRAETREAVAAGKEKLAHGLQVRAACCLIPHKLSPGPCPAACLLCWRRRGFTG